MEGVCKRLDPEFNYNNVLGDYTEKISTFDIEYLERRGTTDLEKFAQTPQKMMETEISVNLLEVDVKRVKKEIDVIKYSKYMNMAAFMSIAAFDNSLNPYVRVSLAVLSFITIYK